MALKKENQELNEEQEKNQCKIHNDFMTGEKPRQTEKISSRKRAQKTKPNSFGLWSKQHKNKTLKSTRVFTLERCLDVISVERVSQTRNALKCM